MHWAEWPSPASSARGPARAAAPCRARGPPACRPGGRRDLCCNSCLQPSLGDCARLLHSSLGPWSRKPLPAHTPAPRALPCYPMSSLCHTATARSCESCMEPGADCGHAPMCKACLEEAEMPHAGTAPLCSEGLLILDVGCVLSNALMLIRVQCHKHRCSVRHTVTVVCCHAK